MMLTPQLQASYRPLRLALWTVLLWFGGWHGGTGWAHDSPSLDTASCCDSLATWIVSSRRLDEHEACGYPDVYRVNVCDGTPTSEQELLASLPPGSPVVIMVHGSFVSEELAWQDIRRTADWLRHATHGTPCTLIGWTWPSDDTQRLIPYLDVNRLGRQADAHAAHLARFVHRLPGTHPICLIGHSHGARVCLATLHLLAGGTIQHNSVGGDVCPQRRMRAVLAAAAVDTHWLNPRGRYACAPQRAECILNLANERDWALRLYSWRAPGIHKALGLVGLDHWRSRRAREYPNLAEWDVTGLVGRSHVWHDYTAQPAIACGIREYLYLP